MSNLSQWPVVFAGTAVLIVWIALTVRVLQEHERAVVFRLGRVRARPKGPGLITVLPFGIDRIRKVSLQVVAMNVPPQDVITKDNIRMRLNTVVYCRVVEPVRAVVQVQDYLLASREAAQTRLRAILGRFELDTLLSEPESINRELHGMIARVTHDWGVEVIGVEIKDLTLPGGEQVDYAALRGQQSGEADVRVDESMEGIISGPGSLATEATRDIEANAKQEGQDQARQLRPPKIFLCYRREDTRWAARSIYESLSDKYGHEQVFRDIDSTPAGVRFSTWIEARIGQCNAMIVLIGDAWFSAKDEAGQRRLELPEDWVRKEIEAGLRRKVPIVPVCVQGARMPTEDELPSSIADLAGFQSTEVTDSRWDFDVERLLQAVDDRISSGDDQ
jgi:regulator of protease activity HflC (stomatin/prohibitin superfamily)